MLKYFLDNNLIYPKQSGFRPSDSCINQLLSVTHIVTSLYNSLEIRGVLTYLAKALDKVWHNGLTYKLKLLNGIENKMLSFNFLKNCMYTLKHVLRNKKYCVCFKVYILLLQLLKA